MRYAGSPYAIVLAAGIVAILSTMSETTGTRKRRVGLKPPHGGFALFWVQ